MSDVKSIKMSVAVRLMLLMNLPEQGTVTEMISKRNVRKKIDFSSEEVEEFGIKNEDSKIIWKTDSREVDVEFTNTEIDFLKSIVTKLDESGNITDNILDFADSVLNS